jgi:hypothetical protein
MRALADAQAEDGSEAPADLQATDLEDEEDPQDLDELNLGMEVRDGDGGDGARLAGEGPRAHAPAPA